MTYPQMWGRRLGQALAVLRDPDAGLLPPLPPPLVDPRLDAGRLIAEARQKGLEDGAAYLYDGWSFGHEGDPPDAVGAPAYVAALRRRRDTALHEHRDRQRQTEDVLAGLYDAAQDADRDMRQARDRMARVAAREQLDEDRSLRAYLRRRDLDAERLPLPPLDHPVWEGEAPPMGLLWRVFILLFLGVVVFVIEHYVAGAYLPLTDLGRTTGRVLTGAIAAATVAGPLVSGQLFRHRHATGYDRPLAVLTFVLLLPTLAIIGGFGLLAASLFDHGVTGAGGPAPDASRTAALGLTPATLVVVFDVVLFLACAMAYLLGLAQRHPFQQAFARSRRIRNRTVDVVQRMGARINPDFRAVLAPGDGGQDGDGRTADREAAVRSAYRAAEEAYYQGLVEAVADPTFTEAVMRHRSRAAAGPAGDPETGGPAGDADAGEAADD
ncbi:hypothetical protein [Actinoplanes siamensis]|uniref:Uncharacterized protein n=1 Tax=Actinoplanes siamensis TaxID=1223317 RepID=A0A919N9N6_9ACTN|nr:hypothetical protein [Actinoplanes siamensis]GIF06857.1 hypothetical protein Asi03nite_43950 [Actinoplanes siamensis]